jgi:hypothetical protein
MTRAILAIWTTVLVLCVSGDLRLMLREAVVAGTIPTAAKDACAYYKQRAGSGAAHTPVRLEAMLSDSCVVAMRSLRGYSEEERVAAAVYLTRIAELHQVVAEMNARRGTAGPAPGIGAEVPGQVTPTGEFLIAHRIGVIRAFEAWLDTGADFSLASYR